MVIYGDNVFWNSFWKRKQSEKKMWGKKIAYKSLFKELIPNWWASKVLIYFLWWADQNGSLKKKQKEKNLWGIPPYLVNSKMSKYLKLLVPLAQLNEFG
jgi:hypothetical protein